MFIYFINMRHKDNNKKEKIIKAAIQLINKVGLAEVSMLKIAKKAGVATATIYVYFDNKKDMLKKLFLVAKKDMQQKVLRGINISLPTESEFKKVLKNYIDFIINNRDYFLFLEQYMNTPLILKLYEEESQMIDKTLLEFFKNGIKLRIIKEIDFDLMLIYAISPIMQIAKKYFNGEFEFTEQNIEKIIQMSWASIKK
jgi:AcrR family transcriptional regulator